MCFAYRRMSSQSSPLQVFAVMLAILAMQSCTFYKDIEVSEVHQVNIRGFDQNGISAIVTLEIHNPNGYRLLARKGEVNVMLNNRPSGVITFDEKHIIPRKSKQDHSFVLTGAFTGGAGSFLDNLLNVLVNREATITGEGYIQGRAFFVKRKVPVVFTEKVDMREMNRK